MSAETGTSDIRSRLRSRIGTDEEPFRWARRAGIPTTTFGRVWNDGQIPKAATAAKMAAALGVSIDWLLTGKGEPEGSPPNEVRVHLADEDLMSKIGELVANVHREMGISLPQAQLFRVVARKHNEVMAAQPGEGELPVMLKLLETQLRAELKEARSEPGTGKRSA